MNTMHNALLRKGANCVKNSWSLSQLAAMNNINESKQIMKPTSKVADTLLTEVNNRLADQHAKCIAMMNKISEKREATPSSSTNSNGKKVIRAVNLPVIGMTSMKEFMEQATRTKRVEETVTKSLKDLEILHKDTFSITEHLLSDGKPTLERFSPADKALIAATFEQIRSRHAATVENMADIVISLRSIASNQENIILGDDLVNEFLRDRLAIQLLCDHYVGLDKCKAGGGISIECDFEDVLTDAVLEAKHICDANFGIAPEVHVLQESSTNIINVSLIRPWAHHVLVEILKNSMTSSVQHASIEGSSVSPSCIYIGLNDGNGSLVCNIYDQGLGLDEKGIQRAFRFADSSASRRWDRIDEQQSYAMVRAPISSLGVGLSMSKMMMAVNGGSIHLENRMKDLAVSNNKSLSPGCTASIHFPQDDRLDLII